MFTYLTQSLSHSYFKRSLIGRDCRFVTCCLIEWSTTEPQQYLNSSLCLLWILPDIKSPNFVALEGFGLTVTRAVSANQNVTNTQHEMPEAWLPCLRPHKLKLVSSSILTSRQPRGHLRANRRYFKRHNFGTTAGRAKASESRLKKWRTVSDTRHLTN